MGLGEKESLSRRQTVTVCAGGTRTWSLHRSAVPQRDASYRTFVNRFRIPVNLGLDTHERKWDNML
jgi:hypothetical protein